MAITGMSKSKILAATVFEWQAEIKTSFGSIFRLRLSICGKSDGGMGCS